MKQGSKKPKKEEAGIRKLQIVGADITFKCRITYESVEDDDVVRVALTHAYNDSKINPRTCGVLKVNVDKDSIVHITAEGQAKPMVYYVGHLKMTDQELKLFMDIMGGTAGFRRCGYGVTNKNTDFFS